MLFFFFFQAEDGIRDSSVTGVQTCALPICRPLVLQGKDSTPRWCRRPCAAEFHPRPCLLGGQVRRQRRRARVFRFTPDCRHVDQRWISSVWARIGLVPFWSNMEARGSEASSRAGLLLVGYLASRCCVNHSVAGPAEASKSFT